MKRLSILCGIVILSTACALLACDRSSNGEEAELDPSELHITDPGPIERPFLWRVDGPEGPVWLFGTVHAGVDATGWQLLPADVRSAIDDSQTVVLEVDLQDLARPEVAEQVVLDDDQSLEEKLGSDHWETLTAIIDMPLLGPDLDEFQPWVVYSMLAQNFVGELVLVGSVDEAIATHADQRGLDTEYLETIEEQVEVLSDSFDVDYLKEVLDDPEHYRDQLQRLLDGYVAGDEDILVENALEAEHLEEHPEIYDRVYVERNRAWIPDIEEYIERGDVFIAVGAGHLVGDDSVISMLEDEGYDVERVSAGD